MKGLGLGAVGVGTAAAALPVVHDLDELLSAPQAIRDRPWWVKERELFDPTVEVDWSILKRYDRRLNAQTRRTQSFYPEYYARRGEYSAIGDELEDAATAAQVPGFDQKFDCLNEGRVGMDYPHWSYAGIEDESEWADTPEEMGYSPWSGTPEENSRLLLSAMRYYGAAHVGFAELDSTWRNKLIVTHTTTGARSWTYSPEAPLPPENESMRYEYKDIPRAYAETHSNYERRTAGVAYIPTKPLWYITMTHMESMELQKIRARRINKPNSSTGGPSHGILKTRLFNFQRALGNWQAFGFGGHQDGETNYGAATVLTGISEHSRQNLYTLTPDMAAAHNPFGLLTDMPLAPTKPIDAGIWRFCIDCAKCAVTCPGQAISYDKEPSWEIPLTEGRPSTYHNPGPKSLWCDMMECRRGRSSIAGMCSICYGTCSFAEDREAMIHSVVAATVATTGLFNGFMANMSEWMGYGMSEDAGEWWNMSLPVFGVDTSKGAHKGAY
jgi:reductive dehalogenase